MNQIMKLYDNWWENTLLTLPESNIDDLLYFTDEPDIEDISNSIYPLVSWSVISIFGPDSIIFLQGQLTTNLEDIEVGQCTLSSHCDPKGRMNSNFYLYRQKKEEFLLILPSNNSKNAFDALKKYSIFSNVEIIDKSNDLAILGINFEIKNDFNDKGIYCLIKTSSPLDFIIINKNQNPIIEIFSSLSKKNKFIFRGEYCWLFQLIRCGVAFINDKDINKYLPQMFNLDALGALNFKKGCYTGQEVIARTKYRGKVKRRCLPFKTISKIQKDYTDKLKSNESILNSENQIMGSIINYTFNPNKKNTFIYGLMIIKSFDELQSKNQKLKIKLLDNEDIEITPLDLPYSLPI